MGSTIQKLIDDRMRLWAACQGRHSDGPCHHMRELDLLALRDRLGPDASTMAADLTPRLRCSRCGGKEIGLTLIPYSGPSGDPRGILDGTAWSTRENASKGV
jgi:hypothetical protein